MNETKNSPVRCDSILVPVDGSKKSYFALLEAIELAEATGAGLVVMMVVDYNENIAAFERVTISGEVPAELRIKAYQFLPGLMHEIPAHIPARTRVETGKPGEGIVDAAEDENSDLIVMGSSGFGTFRRVLFGSTAAYVLRYADCPVLFCKGGDEEEKNAAAPDM